MAIAAEVAVKTAHIQKVEIKGNIFETHSCKSPKSSDICRLITETDTIYYTLPWQKFVTLPEKDLE